MAFKIMNYKRFYTLLKAMPIYAEKEALVASASGGRTTSLRELSLDEYNALCASMEAQVGYKDTLRKTRSAALKLMTQMGVNTASWAVVNAFVEQPRIAGKPFARLSIQELQQLSRKLRSIMRKRPAPSGAPTPTPRIISFNPSNHQIPS